MKTKLWNLLKEKINTLISVQHKWIMSKKILSKFGCNAFNFHNAKLPEYKGYNSLSHSILNGDSKHFDDNSQG